MNKYLQQEIDRLKETIKFLATIKVDAEATYKKDYYAFESIKEFKPDEIEIKSKYLSYVIKLLEYYQEKLGDKETLTFGKHIDIDLSFYGERLSCGMYANGELRSKLYTCVFGSFSGINEFFDDHFPDLFSVILGNTGYSYALNSFDIKNGLRFFEKFGYSSYDKDSRHLYWNDSDFEKDLEKGKAILDWFFKLSNNEELMADIDKVLDTYFDVVFKYNPEE